MSPATLALHVGQKSQLTRTITPINATNQNVTWSSDNAAIATVSNTGLVTAIANGTTTIRATTQQGSFVAQTSVTVTTPLPSYSTRLTGTANEKYGLAKSLSVMPGDTITMEVWAKYLDTNTNNWSAALTNLVGAIANGTAPTGTFIDGGAAGSIGGTTFPYTGVLPRTGDSGTGPKAYLNYIVFDKNYGYKTGGFKRLSATPKENGSDVAHEKLAFEGVDKVIIKEAGYVYIYLSNENDTPVEVFFDDFKVKHSKGPIVSSQDYYPFGLTYNSYQRENSIQQPYQYNGKEIQDELNLQWMDYGARMYDAQIGRWHVVDPLADAFPNWSSYAYGYNNPIRFTDPFGMSNEDEVDNRTDNEFEGRGANGSWNFRETRSGGNGSGSSTTSGAGCASCANGFGIGGDLLAKGNNSARPNEVKNKDPEKENAEHENPESADPYYNWFDYGSDTRAAVVTNIPFEIMVTEKGSSKPAKRTILVTVMIQLPKTVAISPDDYEKREFINPNEASRITDQSIRTAHLITVTTIRTTNWVGLQRIFESRFVNNLETQLSMRYPGANGVPGARVTSRQNIPSQYMKYARPFIP